MNITSFINSSSNDLISRMHYSDKEELLNLLKSYKIELRDILNMDSSSTFGLEIEYNGDFNRIHSLVVSKNYEWLKNKRLNNVYWNHAKDNSVPDGGEVISPILYDKVESWKQINEICNLLKENNSSVSENTAAHIHFGTQIIGSNINYWLKFLKLYAAYESVLFRFSYGEYECERPYLISHANPLALSFLKTYNKYNNEDISFKKMIRSINFSYKTDAIKMTSIINGGTSFKENRTIEFRSPNGTLEPIIWQNNINVFYHLMKYSISPNYNDDIINK